MSTTQKNKRGRRPSGRPKKKLVSICLSPVAIDRLRKIVGKNGSASAWIESQILSCAEQYLQTNGAMLRERQQQLLKLAQQGDSGALRILKELKDLGLL